MAEPTRELQEMTDFGVFYPRGHLVAAFPRREDAERVRQDLLTGGYDEDDCVLISGPDVARTARQNLEQNTGILARLGKSDEAVKAHLRAAEAGGTFLVIYAPGDLEAERAMKVVRRVPFDFVHRYQRFAIQVLR
jgi:hypothetical protein